MARLPQINGKRFIGAMEKLGWVVHHQKGSHVVLKNPEEPSKRLVVPAHDKPLKKGILSGLLKTVGITGDRLRDLA